MDARYCACATIAIRHTPAPSTMVRSVEMRCRFSKPSMAGLFRMSPPQKSLGKRILVSSRTKPRSILVRTFIRKHKFRDKLLAALLRKGLGGPVDMSDNTQLPTEVSTSGKAISVAYLIRPRFGF